MAPVGSTKERIRIVAERLFAQNGFHNTSLRAITSEAEVNLAAVNYHYGSKEALLEAIFDYHLIPLNNIRLERLRALQQQSKITGAVPDLEAVLRAFIEPSMAFRADKKARSSFIALVAQAIHAPDDTLRNIFFVRVGPVVKLFGHLLADSLPQLLPLQVNGCLSFILGAMNAPVISTHMQPGTPVPTGCGSGVDVELLLDFIVNGLGAKK